MGTQAKEVTEKAATNSSSKKSLLQSDAPELRTAKAIVRKHEQIQHALEHERISGKVAEQMNQTLKGIMGVARLELQYWGMMQKFGRKARVPRSPVLRSLVGLPEEVSPTDGEHVRALTAGE